MVRKGCLPACRSFVLGVTAFVLLASSASTEAQQAGPAQTAAWRFHWQPGQVLTYRAEQASTVTQVIGPNKTESRTRLGLVKKWQVLAVDAAGVATLQMSLAALRMETTLESGESLVFDSAAPEKSTPQLRDQMAAYVGGPLVVLRIDERGKVLEVKDSKFGPASKYENETPFAITLPETMPTSGQGWERKYQITLEPPAGTGEKYQAVQKYGRTGAAGTTVTLSVSTTLVTQPDAPADQTPLLQFQPEGEVVFDTRAGVVRSVSLHVTKEVPKHQGEDSSYRFQSTYSEQLVPGN
jgi:hypothetical protein